MNSVKKRIVVVPLLLWSLGGSAQVLVSGTDFECPKKAINEYGAISDIEFTGILPGTVSVDAPFPADVDYDFKNKVPNSSHFHTKSHYAITSNPIILDSLNYVDAPKDGWGIVFSPARVTVNKTLLTYQVAGLAPNSTATVKIEYRSVIDDDLAANKSCANGAGRAQFKVAINADQYNITQGEDVKQVAMGAKGSYSNAMVKVGADGLVDIRINATTGYSGDCHAFEITKIEVLGNIAPEIICTDGESVCAGEFANFFKSGTEYVGATYQWYKDGQAISGATSPNYTFETPANPGSFEFRLDVTYGGKTFKSNTLKIVSEKCCEITVDGKSVPASRKVIFKEDFGEFDLSDKKGTTYKVWDFSDISNPVQVTKTTATPFRYALDDAPLGCKFNGTKGPLVDGEYTVAGVLTGYNPVQGMDGAMLEWANRIGGKKKPLDTPEMDHSGKLEGCALFVNCNPHTKGQNIYERTISNLCQNRQLFFECYFSVFTNSASGTYNPVDITARLSEVGNADNKVEMKGTATNEESGGTGTWVKLSCQIFLEKKDAVLLEIVNNSDVSENGNDLVLDDIIIRACAAPSLQAYFDLNTLAVDTVTCSNTESEIEIYAKPSEMLTNYFGGEANTRFLYQWSKTPKDKKSWKNIGSLSTVQKMKAGETPFVGAEDGQVIYFRVIAGSEYTLENTDEADFNRDDPCASYTISDEIPCRISCPTCTEPKDLIIASSMTTTTSEPYKVVNLCKGESTTLSTKDVSVDGYDQYRISWHRDTRNSKEIAYTIGTTADPLVVDWSDATKEGTMFYVKVYDNAYPEANSCYKYDSIQIIANPSPVGENIVLDPMCENDPARKTALTQAMAKYSEYKIVWEDELLDLEPVLAGDLGGAPAPAPLAAPNVETADPREKDYVYFYSLIDPKTGCVSEEKYSFTFTINPIPEEELAAIDPFCAGSKEVKLPKSAKGYTVNWYTSKDKGAAAETDLSKLEGSTTPYKYWYTLVDASKTTNCESEPAEYEFTVKPAAKVTLAVEYDCDLSTVTATPTPSGATVTWSTGAKADKLEVDNVALTAGTYTAVASAEGYCDSEEASMEVKFYPTPADLKGTSPEYLKADGTPDFSKISYSGAE
ncbi:MAG: hypothetical protein J6Y37_15250, partial [Paludibacteraceae bacterium]|nr:hypothetical protein [Paludibacteraceae bacterium]